jgi:hypothetical protein
MVAGVTEGVGAVYYKVTGLAVDLGWQPCSYRVLPAHSGCVPNFVPYNRGTLCC